MRMEAEIGVMLLRTKEHLRLVEVGQDSPLEAWEHGSLNTLIFEFRDSRTVKQISVVINHSPYGTLL